jgi:hypothetical protein
LFGSELFTNCSLLFAKTLRRASDLLEQLSGDGSASAVSTLSSTPPR